MRRFTYQESLIDDGDRPREHQSVKQHGPSVGITVVIDIIEPDDRTDRLFFSVSPGVRHETSHLNNVE